MRVTCTVSVRNDGAAAGNALALLFVRDPIVPGLNRYWKRLAGWARVDVAPGATADARIDVLAGTLKFHDPQMVRRLYPGTYTFSAAQSHLGDAVSADVDL